MRRRLVARVIAMLLAFPLLLRGEDGGCSLHENAHAPDVQAAATPTEGHQHQHENPAPSKLPHEHHLPSGCCPTMSSCSSSATISVTEVALAYVVWQDVGQVTSADFLHSRVESPDPPPPRA